MQHFDEKESLTGFKWSQEFPIIFIFLLPTEFIFNLQQALGLM